MLLSTLAVSLPANLLALAREQGRRRGVRASLCPWFLRFAAVAAGAAVLTLASSRAASCWR